MGPPLVFAFASIPPRVEANVGSLVEVMTKHQTRPPDVILLSYPKTFRRFAGIHEAPSVPGLTVHRPVSDEGPATKWLGALEYIAGTPELKNALLIIGDDDIDYKEDFLELMERRLLADATKVYAGYIEPDEIGPFNVRVAQGCSGIGMAAPVAAPLLQVARFEDCFRTDDVWVSDAFQKLGVEVVNVVPSINGYAATRHIDDAGDYQEWLTQSKRSDAGGLFYEPEAGSIANEACANAAARERGLPGQHQVRECLCWIIVMALLALAVWVALRRWRGR